MATDLTKYINHLKYNETDTFNSLLKLINVLQKETDTSGDNNTLYQQIHNRINPIYGFPDEGDDINADVNDLSIRTEDALASDVETVNDGDNYNANPSYTALNNVFSICTNTTHVPNYYDLTQIPTVRYIFIVIYILVIVVSFVGNFMVIWTVTRNRHMRTVTNYYIRNLAVCDFLVAALVMPLKLLEYTAPCSWQVFAKDALCSVIYYILPVFVFASVLTLVAISLERCHAIVSPFNSLTMHSKTRTRLILVATWLIPIIVASPYMYCKGYAFSIQSPYGTVSRQICTDRFDEIDAAIYGDDKANSGRFRKGFFIFITITMYMVPMIVIVTTCIRIARCLLTPMESDPQEQSSYGLKMTRKRGESKRRVARMIITVAIAFIVCWTPFYLVSFISQVQKVSFLYKSNFLFTMLATHLSGFLNSAINPFIYHFMSEKFRKSFNIMARSLFCWCPNNLWHRKGNQNSSPQYSWAMKCEEYYCQHRLQKPQPQQHSSSSHSQSKNDFGGHIASTKFKNNHYNDEGSSTAAQNNSPRKSPRKYDPTQQQQQQHIIQKVVSQKDNNKSNHKKDVTIFKTKQNTSLYCGPLCVCQCQGCSIQSSSSTAAASNLQNGKPYAENIPMRSPEEQGGHLRVIPKYSNSPRSVLQRQDKQQTIDTLADSSVSLLSHNSKNKKLKQQKQRQPLTYIEMQCFNKENIGDDGSSFIVVKRRRNDNSVIRIPKNTDDKVEEKEEKERMNSLCSKNTLYSRSDGQINVQDKNTYSHKLDNGKSRTSLSTNHLVL